MKYAILAAALAACAHGRDSAAYSTDVANLFASRHAAIQQCYATVVKAMPAAAGRVAVQFAVQPKTGALVDTRLDTRTTAPAPVGQCVLDNLAGLALEPPDRNRGEATWVWDFSAVPAGT